MCGDIMLIMYGDIIRLIMWQTSGKLGGGHYHYQVN